MKNQEKSLWGNTIMLYIMTFSTQLLNLITMPYLTRVLGPVAYGRISVAVAYSFYLQLLLDFGMILYATRKIAQNREDVNAIDRIVSGVTCIKLIFASILFAAFLMISAELMDREARMLYTAYFLSTAIAAIIPDFYYRGIEQMRSITMRTLIARGFFTVMIFLLVKNERQILFVPVMLAMANCIALCISWIDLYRRGVRLRRITMREMTHMLKGALPFLGSRIAGTFYQGLNTVLIGAMYGQTAIVGFYGAADKLISAAKSAVSPVADSLFPYMVKHKDYKLIRRLMRIFMPVIAAGVLLAFVFAQPLCMLLFGEEYRAAGGILRLMLPIALVLFPSYILCFPVLVPMGLQKYANLSNGIGAAVQIIGLALLYIAGRVDAYALCILASISEVSVFLFRLIVFMRRYNRNKGNPA